MSDISGISPTQSSSTPSTSQLSDVTTGSEKPSLEPIFLAKEVSPRTPTSNELNSAAQRAEVRLNAGDRAGAYLELYQVTGNEQLLMQAQITTYSGSVGGMALEGNFRAKMANPEHYKITLDTFSHQIDQAVVDLASQSAKSNSPEKFSTFNIMEADRKVWEKNGMAEHFPGNAQYIGIKGYESVAQTEGSIQAILAQDDAEMGRRPAEYASNPNYETQTSDDGRFITVINKTTHRIEVFFDKKFESDTGSEVDGLLTPDLEQLANKIPDARVQSERQLKMNFVQAGEMVPIGKLAAFNADAPRPPANLDRVFDFGGKLYQVDDKALFTSRGIELDKLAENSFFEGIDYATELNEIGDEVDAVIENKGFSTAPERQEKFNDLVDKKVIVPLTPAETKYYDQALDQLKKDQLPAPYQSTGEAHNSLRWELFTELESQLPNIAIDT